MARFGLTRIIEATRTTPEVMLSKFPWDQRYRVSDIDDVLTPALVLYPEIIASNIAWTLHLLGDNADRWRAHIKTAKLAYTLRMLVERGCRNLKCATTLELLVACRSGAADVLLAYPVVGPSVRRVREIVDRFPDIRISVLAENEEQVRQWRGSPVGVFLDINPGMNRTGVEQSPETKLSDLCVGLKMHAWSSAACTTMTGSMVGWMSANGPRRRMPAMIVCWSLSTTSRTAG